jgi:hypothetical protein
MILTLTNVLGSTVIAAGATGGTGPVPPTPMMILWNTAYAYVPNAQAEEDFSTEYYYKYNLPEQP